LKIEKKKKDKIISSLIFNSMFGITLITGGYLFFKSVLNKGIVISYSRGIVISIGIIILVGIYLLRKPFIEINRFYKVFQKNKKEILKTKKY
jgi:hypothetical protein